VSFYDYDFFSTVEELIKDQLEAAKPELIADDIVS
jgi:hypothetical protein